MAARLGLRSSHRISSHHKSSHHVAFPLSYSDIPFSSLLLIVLLFASFCFVFFSLLQPGTSSYFCLNHFLSNASISFQCCHFLILPLHCSLSEPLPLSFSGSPFFLPSHFLSVFSPLHPLLRVTSHSLSLLFVQLFLILLSFPFPPVCLTSSILFPPFPFVCFYLPIPPFSVCLSLLFSSAGTQLTPGQLACISPILLAQ